MGSPLRPDLQYWRWERGTDPESWRLLRCSENWVVLEEYTSDGEWVATSGSALDAISGMGADEWSSGEWAFQISIEEAEAMVRRISAL